MSLAFPAACVTIPPACDFLSRTSLRSYAAKHMAAPVIAFEAHHQFPNGFTNGFRWGVALVTQGKIGLDVYDCVHSLKQQSAVCLEESQKLWTNAVLEQISQPTHTPQPIHLQTPDPDICDNPVKNPFSTSSLPNLQTQHNPKPVETSAAKSLSATTTSNKKSSQQSPFRATTLTIPLRNTPEHQHSKRERDTFQLASKTIQSTTPKRSPQTTGIRNPRIRAAR